MIRVVVLMHISEDMWFDFVDAAAPKTAAERGPVYYLWVFDPQEDKVIVEHNEGRHPAEHIDHSHLAERVPHPDRIHGYAHRTPNGWRITTDQHRPVDDPHVLKAVSDALKSQ